MNAHEKRKDCVRQISEIQSGVALCAWDQQTQMPEKGADARAKVVGRLERWRSSGLYPTGWGRFLPPEREVPGLWDKVEAGQFSPIREWLRGAVHRHGRVYLPDDLVRRGPGSGLFVGPFLRYIRRKYGEVYGLARV